MGGTAIFNRLKNCEAIFPSTRRLLLLLARFHVPPPTHSRYVSLYVSPLSLSFFLSRSVLMLALDGWIDATQSFPPLFFLLF
jgi:hypothetical protein